MKNLTKTETRNTSQRNISINKFINNLLFLNSFDAFKIVYTEECKSQDEWYQCIFDNIGGFSQHETRHHNVHVAIYVYCEVEDCFKRKDFYFENVLGRDIPNCCFRNIPEINDCDMIRIQTSAVDSTFWSMCRERYEACYLYVRS